MFVEATKMPGSGKLHLTGSLGNVLQESAQIALSWVKANAFGLGLTLHPKERLAKDDDIHIHLPHGSIPKDGPSAGKEEKEKKIIATLIPYLRRNPHMCTCIALLK